ncbi:SDR family NAD(P)-dependent oxidoreductase [Aquamicrobium sp. LC103]|uniref:SDR family NAD(P)-dependent oxidoreductase n=1 Tax=Aquamicrobium sp. LC103 TaxID=1120658 RepID=UPI00063EC1E2|nr:SDR family NAD(P)-dependent oxidoreductase [Aquamicrobium sp. LC103]TKT78275.1 SDR family oxidoreductase [Aquamicrobium sp. LC103]
MPNAQKPAAIVTGAGSGIGRAIARRFAAEGYRVVIVDRDEALARRTEELVGSDGGLASIAVTDITDEAAVGALVEGVDGLEVLVNNAGIFSVVPFDELKADDFRRAYEVNLVAMFTLSQKAARRMPNGGRIVNLCSRAAFGSRHYAHYVASKAAVAGFTKALALELAERDISVNAVAPGVIETDMLLARSDTNLDALRAQQPTGRLGRPEDIAHAAAFLASPQAGFITGQVLIVDGGRSIGGTAAF